MAEEIEAPKSSRKRKRLTPIIHKLPRGQKIEVRSIEDGYEGSWHTATVIDGKNQNRVVKYDNMFCDDGSDNLVESVPVLSHNLRGRIRPLPSQVKYNVNCLHYGQCVDVFHEGAWWEGIVYDHDDICDERSVFFPDVGDELRVSVKNIRLTREWNADTDEWKFRGDWIFLEALEDLEEEWPLVVSVKQIWYELRMKKRFEKELKEWTGQMRETWKEIVKEVILDNLKLIIVEFFGKLQWEGHKVLDINKEFLDSVFNIEPSFFDSLANLPFDPSLSLAEDGFDDDDDIHPPGFPNVCVDFKARYRWTQVQEFCVSEPDLAVKPKCCPYSVLEYYNKIHKDIKPSPSLTLQVRQHLLYSGWKVELKKDFYMCKRKKKFRYRYTDPDGKQYRSLRVLCEDLCNQSSSMFFEPDYCPKVLDDFYSMASEVDWRRRDDKAKEILARVKKHLYAVGWTKSYADEMRKRIVYTSPDGKKFYNLRQAFNYHMQKICSRGSDDCSDVNIERSDGRDNQKKDNEKGIGKLVIKKKNGVLSIQPVERVKEMSCLKSVNEETGKPSRKVRVLRSSKRAREEISPVHQTPRTILSWLIDNNVIIPRSNVQYRCSKDGHILKEGRITRDGIKCNCCQAVLSITKFESHARRTNKLPSANIFLEDGRSLLDCQLQLKRNQNAKLMQKESRRLKGNRNKLMNDNDYICSVCHYGGELVLCDQCPSSFHTDCLGLKEVPEGDWFCPSCCCRICNQNKFSLECEQDTDNNILNCEQCEQRYHIGCLNRKGFSKLKSYPQENWFCCQRCEEIYLGINKNLGEAIPVGRDDLKMTILKNKRSKGVDHDMSNLEDMTETYSKLNIAISVMHECFEPVKEPRTQRDIVEDVIFCRCSELNRLNFKGFYTVLLEKDDELVSAATIRIYGEKVAELPLIGTRFRYRRRGMCHALMNVLENKLVELGVERLVLPAVPSVLQTWTSSFGFSVMTEAQKLDFLGYTFLDFQGTHMCQKYLMNTQPSAESSISKDGISAISEVSQVEIVEESVMVDRHPIDIALDSQNDSVRCLTPWEISTNQPSHVECETRIECSNEVSNPKEEDNNGHNGNLKCYQRRKTVACGS
uniref:uncharacterized protein LOC122594582 isoform X2 n=1 Tax=Erigeron canadensis TaxID=72917 RepID=UPI001CB9BDBE|nr:uncharacterized protein LOC122594582 isoform X2 [Erigeron canadensis]